MLRVRRTDLRLQPNSARVLLRDFNPTTDQRSLKIAARIATLSEENVQNELRTLLANFEGRHRNLHAYLLARFEEVKAFLLTDKVASEERKLLIGAYFTHEYALEAAALFNPSLVWHPDQSGVPGGARRFVLSLRATGEGHISSIAFREGIVDAENRITMREPTRFVSGPASVASPTYDHALFERKLQELDRWDEIARAVLATLNPTFTLEELKAAVAFVEQQNRWRRGSPISPAHSILTLALANYQVSFSPEHPISERILFPHSSTEVNGIEDARFVQFRDDDGSVCYYATYTAYDGRVAMPQMLKTEDFLRFEMNTLNGPEVQNKGLALFPRRIHGMYATLSRQDNENIYLMFSDNPNFWYSKEILVRPTFPWEYIQLGNCGSPLETEAGWLVLTHGVGPMRQYAIGAVLLDKEDPTKLLGRLREPLLAPNADEREGYVPNVVYSCGGQINNGELLLPYAAADSNSRLAIIPLDDILNAMV